MRVAQVVQPDARQRRLGDVSVEDLAEQVGVRGSAVEPRRELERLGRALGRSIGQPLAIEHFLPEAGYAEPELDIDDGLGW